MRGYNLVAVFNKERTKMLMCKRIKNPYLGLINMVGGKDRGVRGARVRRLP